MCFFCSVFFWYLLEMPLFTAFIWNDFPHAEKKVYILLKCHLMLYKCATEAALKEVVTI